MSLARLPKSSSLFSIGLVLIVAQVVRAADEPPAPAVPRYVRPVLIRFEGVITPLNEHYLSRKLEQAQKSKADLVVIEIDSPGGYVEASIKIAEQLRDVKWAHTVAFVPSEALSGAAIASLGATELVMHPQAKIGDAGPIYRDEAGMFQHAPEKIRSHLARHVRDLAQAKGRSPAIAEAMVDKDLVVFRVREKESGDEAFMTEAELRAEAKPDRWEKVAPLQESGAGNFLEINGARAVELKFAQGLARDRQELRERFKLEANWRVMQPGAVDLAVHILNNPFITGMLILIGLVSLYCELTFTSGIGALFAGLSFSLFFWSRFLGGTSDWLEVVLFLMGVIFLAVEIFVLPGFGIAGFTGLLLMGASLIMASQDFIWPHTTSQLATLNTTLFVLLGVAVAFVATVVYLSSRVRSLPLFRHMVLAPQTENESATGGTELSGESSRPATGVAFLAPVNVGDQGAAESSLRPAGKARFGNRTIDVVADGAFVDKGSPLEVVQVQGNRVTVREIRTS